MGANLEVMDIGPHGLGDNTVVDDAASIAHFVGKVPLGIAYGTAIKDGEVMIVTEF